MWLQHRIYEAVPSACILAGVTMLAGGWYLGLDSVFAVIWFAVALGLTAYGAALIWRRSRYRRPRGVSVSEAPTAEEMAARRFH